MYVGCLYDRRNELLTLAAGFIFLKGNLLCTRDEKKHRPVGRISQTQMEKPNGQTARLFGVGVALNLALPPFPLQAAYKKSVECFTHS